MKITFCPICRKATTIDGPCTKACYKIEQENEIIRHLIEEEGE